MTQVELGSKEQFSLLDYDAYLNYASIAAMSTGVRESIVDIMEDWSTNGVNTVYRCLDQRASLKGKLAELIGGSAADIALVPSTTVGISNICINYPWQENDRIVVFEGEFPANVTPFQAIAAEKNLEVVFNPLESFYQDVEQGLAELEEQLKKGVRLVAVSLVQFQTGFRMPIKEMSILAHKYGAEILVDAIQGLGMVPFDAVDSGVDYLCSGSHKFLMGPEGAGFIYVSPKRVEHLKPVTAGWLSHEDGLKFLLEGEGHLKYDRPIRKQADFFEPGTPNTLGYFGLEASLDMIQSLGVQNIYDHVQRYHDALEPQLQELGLTSLRSPNKSSRSGSLCFKLPAEKDPIKLSESLLANKIGVGTPDGKIRFAPHWPNNPTEIPKILSALKKS